jgi:hypothetical protein
MNARDEQIISKIPCYTIFMYRLMCDTDWEYSPSVQKGIRLGLIVGDKEKVWTVLFSQVDKSQKM